MTTMTLEDMVARRVYLKEQISHLQEELDQIDDRLRELPIGKTDAGEWTVMLTPNRRLNADRIAQAYPVARFPHLYRPAINNDAVREYIAPIDLEKFFDSGAPRLMVK